MTRPQVNAKLRQVYVAITLVLIVSIAAAFAPLVPGLPKASVTASEKVYEFMRDMSLLIATLAAAYLANVFQKRSTFVAALEREWRGIVATKSALYAFCERPSPTAEDYLAAFCRISETLDNMRIVYKNAGETETLIGLYPYAPLHDMRRALQSIDPRKNPHASTSERRLARDAILQAFYALRETFLEELDLEEPRHPLLISGARRLKKSGAARDALANQDRQRTRQDRHGDGLGRPEIDALLAKLYAEERASDAGNGRVNHTTLPPSFPGAAPTGLPAQARGPEV